MGKIIENYSELIYQTVGLSPTFQKNIIETFVLIFIFVSIRFVLMAIVYRQTSDTKKRYRWRKSITYTVSIIGTLMVGRIWFQGFQSVATFFGIFAAGIAIALQDLIINIAGWLFIM